MDILGIIAIPFGYVMRFCVWAMQNNYLLALLLFAVIVKIVLFPFGIKQQKNMIKQAKFKPREAAIRKKYAGREDKVTQQKMQEEIQAMYREEGFSPLSGCLPLLIQFPILIGLYRVVYNPLVYLSGMAADVVNSMASFATEKGMFNSVNATVDPLHLVNAMNNPEYYAVLKQQFGSEANFPAQVPNMSIFGINLAEVPTFKSWLVIIPILTFVSMFLSMRLTRKLSYQPQQAGGCSNNIMDFTMPLISVWMTFMFPAILGIYWIFQSILGVVQQFVLSKMFPLPVFTEEDYKEAERIYKGKAKKKKPLPDQSGGGAVKKAYNPNSLHHIDDDDYDDDGNYIGDPTGQAYEEAKAEQNDTVSTDPSKPKLKDESDYGKNKKK